MGKIDVPLEQGMDNDGVVKMTMTMVMLMIMTKMMNEDDDAVELGGIEKDGGQRRL
jgi:hypothetical protein